nr:MG2 domain-containing protein [Candidatus Eremiobacteraeota bacterium]
MKRLACKVLVLLGVAVGFVLLGANAVEDQVYIYTTSASIFTPGHAVTPTFQVYGDQPLRDAPLNVKLYAASPDEALAITKDSKPKPNLRLLRSFETSDSLKGDPRTRVANLGALPIGYYQVVASIGKSSASELIDVSTLGIVVNTAGGVSSAYAVDLRSMNRHAGPTWFHTVGSAPAERQFAPIRADADAIGRVANVPAGYIVATTADGSQTIQSTYSYARPAESGFVQTDRPIYRPGTTIDLRAILRGGEIGGYAIPKGTARIVVTGPNGIVLLNTRAPISSFGTVAATAQIPDDAPLGYYEISIDKSIGGSVQVQAYKKPEYAIDFAPTKPFIVGGDPADFKLSAKYFFGRPAAGLHLHYVAYKQRYGIRPYSPYPIEYGWYQIPRVKIAEGDFITGADGSNEVAIDT